MLIHYSELAGDKYPGLSKTDGSSLDGRDNIVYTYAVPALHKDFDGIDGPPPPVRVEARRQIRNPDGTITSIANVRSVTRDPFHSFRYYEALGSTYGSHNIIADTNTRGSRWHSEPASIERIVDLGIENPSKVDDTPGACAITVDFSVFGDKIKTKYGEYSQSDNIEIFFGEFHLLPNTPAAIYRWNIAHDIVSDSAPRVSIKSFPQPKPSAGQVVSYHSGISRVPFGNRPRAFNSSQTIRHPLYLEAGAKIRWKSIAKDCFSWYKIYDGSDMSEMVAKDIGTGHYAMATKAIVSVRELYKFAKDNGIDSGKLILWTPWFCTLAHNNVDSVKHPRLASFIDNVDYIEFDTPQNWKSGGSYNFSVSIIDRDKNTALYSESTKNQNRLTSGKFPDSIKFGKWTIGDTDVRVPISDIFFDSNYTAGRGVDCSQKTTIRYYPSDDLAGYLALYENLYIRIDVHDGTLRNVEDPTYRIN